MEDLEFAGIYIDDEYTTIEVLKHTPREKTEIVYRDQQGPFVRKYFADQQTSYALMQAYGQIYSDHLPQLLRLYTVADKTAAVFEYVPGVSLSQYVAEHGPLPQEQAIRYARDVARALQLLHSVKPTPIIHRDVCGKNVIISNDRAVLIDIGIARLYKRATNTDTTTLGTPGYASPEQYGFGQTSIRSDIYSLGALLFLMLTGQEPVQNLFDTIKVVPGISPEARALLLNCVSFNPAGRLRSATTFLQLTHGNYIHLSPAEVPESQLDTFATKEAAEQEGAHLLQEAEALQPKFAAAEAEAPRTSRKVKHVLFKIWNILLTLVVLLGFLTIFAIAVSNRDVLSPGDRVRENVSNVLLVNGILVVPYIFLTNKYDIWNKPWMKKYTFVKSVAICVAIFFFTAVVAFMIDPPMMQSA